MEGERVVFLRKKIRTALSFRRRDRRYKPSLYISVAYTLAWLIRQSPLNRVVKFAMPRILPSLPKLMPPQAKIEKRREKAPNRPLPPIVKKRETIKIT
jgi:hypothetical protein